ncbi:MAG: CerR family C-terminal domain-containing protein [Rhodobacterales bacterium]|nr:CerR family C-terminal domain-containing protein [Rhodobacterales bacterium]
MVSAGRRAPRSDGEATRQRILEAAGQRIAANGFAATTSKEIAALAEVDLASINHHFGGRAGLYQATLAEAHRRFLDAAVLERLARSSQPAEEKLRALIRLLIGGSAGAARWPLVLIMREVLQPSPHLLTLQVEVVLPKLHLLLPVISDLSGLPPDDPRLWHSLPSVVLPCAIHLMARQMDSPFTNRITSKNTEEIADLLFTFALGGLRAVAAGRG